ncbi:MAG: type II toxin-antitoxin system VapC family toxin, partial [Pseudonocardia sp.]|nr:type II toxin-antitoxin system VapC family toxin [Pseudonocardia sp.]
MIVLDTHAWIWMVDEPGRLSASAAAAIEGAGRLGVCTISCWEMAMLTRRGRIRLDRDVASWVRMAIADPRVDALGLSPDVAVAAALLDGPSVPRDPADRVIYATAR